MLVGILSVQLRTVHSQGGAATEFEFYEESSGGWGLGLIRHLGLYWMVSVLERLDQLVPMDRQMLIYIN